MKILLTNSSLKRKLKNQYTFNSKISFCFKWVLIEGIELFSKEVYILKRLYYGAIQY